MSANEIGVIFSCGVIGLAIAITGIQAMILAFKDGADKDTEIEYQMHHVTK